MQDKCNSTRVTKPVYGLSIIFIKYSCSRRYLPKEEDTIVVKDGNVVDSDKDKLTPTLIPTEDFEIKPVGDDGQPITGANVTLECHAPDRIHSGVEQADGSYTFKDAIRADGSDKCVLKVEKPG